MRATWSRTLFVVGGIYDGLLGLAFLFAPLSIFQWYGITPPNHMAYVQFPALLLIVFAGMFFQISRDPVKHRALIPYGMALKLAYCGTVFTYGILQDIPRMWWPWAWADLMFFILFFLAWRSAGRLTAA